MLRIILISIILSTAWPIGLKGLIIPSNGQVLAMAGTGIAGDIDPSLNPAMHSNRSHYIQFSLNNWLGDISGSHTLYHWGKTIPKHLNIQTWNAKELELWGDKPGDRPLGYFNVHYVATAFSISHHFNTPYRFGLRIQSNYSRLFTESLTGITLDGGMTVPLGQLLTIGAVLRNMGYEYSNDLRSELPIESGAGAAFRLPVIRTKLLGDILVTANEETEFRYGFKTNWRWLNLSYGISHSDKRSAQALGFSFNFGSWMVNYGIYYHENLAVLGIPRFLDVRRYF